MAGVKGGWLGGRIWAKARGLGVFRRGWLANVQPRTTERGDSGGGNANTPERGAERAAGRVSGKAGESITKARAGWSGLKVGLAGWVWSGRRGQGVSPPLPLATSHPVHLRQAALSRGIPPPSMRRIGAIIVRPPPPVAFVSAAHVLKGTPNPALTHPSDNAGANPPDKGHFSVKTPLRYG